MNSDCPDRGASLADRAKSRLSPAGAVVPYERAVRPAVPAGRKRLGIPVAAIVAIGLAASLAIGGGKPASGHAVEGKALVTASLDGKPVPIGSPAIRMMQRQFAPASLHRLSPK